MDKIENIVSAVLLEAADKFVLSEKELAQGRHERFKSRVIRTVKRAVRWHIFFDICIIVIFFTFLLLDRSRDE